MLFVSVAAFAVLRGGFAANGSGDITVGVALGEGFSIKGENPVRIEKGGSASFDIELEEGYFLIKSSLGELDGNTLTVESPAKSDTVYLTVGKKCAVTVKEGEHGKAELVGLSSFNSGDSVSVYVMPDENYEVAAVLVNGTRYPAPAGDVFKFTVETDSEIEALFVGKKLTFMAMTGNLGSTSVDNGTEEYRYGDVLRLRCDYDKGHIVFGGWSEGAFLADGGTLISDGENLDYLLLENSVIYANFYDRTKYSLDIAANYGTLSSELGGEYSPGEYVNLPIGDGTLTREGYTLVSYNTEPDGTGERYSLGAMIKMPREDVKLFAEWVKHIDPSYLRYRAEGDTCTVLGLSETGKNAGVRMLCIPDAIGGKAVTAIAADAFSGCDDIKTVVITNGVKYIGSRAFADCNALETVYFPESLLTLDRSAFSGCTSFSSMRVMAALPRVFDYDYDSALADKHMRLKTTEGNRLIVVGGSSAAFGLNSGLIKESFPDYTVINFSCSAFYGVLPIFEMLKANVRDGDVVVLAPEYYYLMYGVGETDTMINWQYLESNYDILCDIDIRNTGAILNTFTSYLAEKRAYLPGKKTNADNVYIRSGFNETGDLTVNRTNKTAFGFSAPPAAVVTEVGIGKYNELFATLAERGAICLFSFPPQPSGGLSKAEIEPYVADLRERLSSYLDSSSCTVISDVADYFFEDRLFYDLTYHMTLEGAEERTKLLISDLKAYFDAR